MLQADPALTAYSRDLITNAAKQLHAAKMAVFDERSGNLFVTELGRVASHFYIRCTGHSRVQGLGFGILRHMCLCRGRKSCRVACVAYSSNSPTGLASFLSLLAAAATLLVACCPAVLLSCCFFQVPNDPGLQRAPEGKHVLGGCAGHDGPLKRV